MFMPTAEEKKHLLRSTIPRAVLGDELRMEFIEIRDEKQRMVADELDPGPCDGCEEWCSR